ncbi:MAG TPA: VOC family protein [Terriglobia bacterium]|jgi:predicted enzyme related to lactoylglutathione lyase
MKPILFALLVLCIACPLLAQLPTPNADGVTAGHHIFRAKDVDAANKFWITLGGEPAALANIKLMKFPGVLLFISAPRGANPAPSLGGNHGTTVEYITFKSKDLKATLAKLTEAGIAAKSEKGAITLMGPDDVQVRITEDKKLAIPIASDGLVMKVADAAEVSAWYAKWFGAKVSKNGQDTIGEIPGARIVFRATKDSIAPTKGHSLGLLGFEVSDLKTFVQKYQDAGGKLDSQIATAAAANLSVVQLTDPWGTSIEVSQGLKAVK